jgi:hypothetical protein
MKPVLGLLAALALAACAGGTDNAAAPAGGGLVASLTRLVPGAAARAPAPDAAAVAAAGQPTIVALVEATRAAGTLAPFGSNGTHETWRSADGVGVTFDRGILFATRGLGADLLTAETAPVLAAWPSGTYPRTVRHLDGENRVVATRLSCTLSDMGRTEIAVAGTPRAVRHGVEVCTAAGLAEIRNDYWREGDTMRQSRQWISPALGHVTLQRITD